MALNRDQELWAVALWVEKHHGKDGWLHIAQQQDRLLEQNDFVGAEMWKEVSQRFDKLSEPGSTN